MCKGKLVQNFRVGLSVTFMIFCVKYIENAPYWIRSVYTQFSYFKDIPVLLYIVIVIFSFYLCVKLLLNLSNRPVNKVSRNTSS